MNVLTALVTAMLVANALEDRNPWFILAFAGACALGSIYECLAVRLPCGHLGIGCTASILVAHSLDTGNNNK
jgi:hypothetical protein